AYDHGDPICGARARNRHGVHASCPGPAAGLPWIGRTELLPWRYGHGRRLHVLAAPNPGGILVSGCRHGCCPGNLIHWDRNLPACDATTEQVIEPVAGFWDPWPLSPLPGGM